MTTQQLKKAAASTEDTLRAAIVILVLGVAAVYLAKGKTP